MDVTAEHGPADDIVTPAQIEELRSEVAELRARLGTFEQILQLRDAALAASANTNSTTKAPPTAALPSSFEIGADQLLPAQDGFHHLEWGPEGAFRWTGPSADIHFEAWLDRSSPLVATIRIFHFGTPANAKDMVIEVDGVLYTLTREGNQKVLRSAPIAIRAGDGPTRLTLKVPHMHSPADRGLADKRILGIAFQHLSIERI
jgi:hypothetical protein